MTSKTSLFNKGIYFSTIKRFMWGSIVYFAALFLFNVLPFLVSDEHTYSYVNIERGWYLFKSGMNSFNVILSSIVPYVAALLVFRFVHSKKQTIFIHSLPANKSTIYFSTLISALTLMVTPVILNAVLLVLLSYSKYSYYISISSVLAWTGINILCHIVMFSFAAFCCMLTGNSFGAAIIYFILHLVPLIISSMTFEFLSDFILGYGGHNTVTSLIGYYNPFAVLYNISDAITKIIHPNSYPSEINISVVTIVYIIISIVLYFVAFALYKKRKLENAEEVAGFKVMNPIFKYLVTFAVAVSTLAAIVNFSYISPVASVVTFILTTSVSYFICEMVLRKSLRVFGAYKGYLSFVVIISCVLIVTKITGGFGYQDYIPELNNVKSATIHCYNGFKDNVAIDNPEFIKLVSEIHKDRIDNGNIIKNHDSRYAFIYVRYEMNDGKTINRRYHISEKELNDTMNKLYNFDEYVINYDNFFSVDKDNIIEVQLNDDKHAKQFLIDLSQQNGLYEAIKKDTLSLTYSEMYCIRHTHSTSVAFKFLVKDKDGANDYDDYRKEYTRVTTFAITPYYKNTIQWLEKEGYLNLVKIPHDGKLYVRQGEYTYIEGAELRSDTIIIDDQSKVEKILDYVLKTPTKDTSSEAVYTIYYNPVPEATSSVQELCEVNLRLMPEEFKEYIKIKLP